MFTTLNKSRASKWLLQWAGVLRMNTLFHFMSKNLLKKKSLGHILLTGVLEMQDYRFGKEYWRTMQTHTRCEMILVGALLALILAVPSYGYLDAGTGSYIAQIVVAFITGAIFVFKGYMAKIVGGIKSFVKKLHADSGRKA